MMVSVSLCYGGQDWRRTRRRGGLGGAFLNNTLLKWEGERCEARRVEWTGRRRERRNENTGEEG
jgi:hypothetical protein